MYFNMHSVWIFCIRFLLSIAVFALQRSCPILGVELELDLNSRVHLVNFLKPGTSRPRFIYCDKRSPPAKFSYNLHEIFFLLNMNCTLTLVSQVILMHPLDHVHKLLLCLHQDILQNLHGLHSTWTYFDRKSLNSICSIESLYSRIWDPTLFFPRTICGRLNK